MVNPLDDLPVYRQIASHIREEIERGHFLEGDQLPSEAQLIKRYGVARMTIRNAMNVLQGEGLVTAKHGSGRYVRHRKPDRQHSVSVSGIVTDGIGRVLLIKRRDTLRWEPPGGVLELPEFITEGLMREVREETGLTIEPVALTGVYKNMVRGIVALVFRCKVVSGHLTVNNEVSDFCWAGPDEVRTMADEAFAVRVLDSLADRTIPAVRQHDGVHLI